MARAYLDLSDMDELKLRNYMDKANLLSLSRDADCNKMEELANDILKDNLDDRYGIKSSMRYVVSKFIDSCRSEKSKKHKLTEYENGRKEIISALEILLPKGI